MQTPLITDDPAQAREQLAAYNRQLARRDDPEYRAIAGGYAELAAGRPLLNLKDCFATVPLDEKGRPRLAIARADRRTVAVSRQSHNRVLFDTRKNTGPWNSTLAIGVDVPPSDRHWFTGYALVPLIPAAVREQLPLGNKLTSCHILWEVQEWSDRPLGAQADRDPYLLRYLGGDLWVVLAEWDLSELERAVMSGRAQQ